MTSNQINPIAIAAFFKIMPSTIDRSISPRSFRRNHSPIIPTTTNISITGNIKFTTLIPSTKLIIFLIRCIFIRTLIRIFRVDEVGGGVSYIKDIKIS